MQYKLDDYLQFEGTATSYSMTEDIATGYSQEVFNSAMRQYKEDRSVNARKGCLRMSTLGKPAVLQMLELPHIQEDLTRMGVALTQQEVIDERKSLMFHLGDVYEAWFGSYVRRQGLNVIPPPTDTPQWEFTYDGVKGHGDFVIQVPETNVYFMVDTKACGSRIVKDMVSDPVLNKPEYVTQISLYAHCLRKHLPIGSVVVPVLAALALDERRIHYIHISRQQEDYCVARASKVIEALSSLKTFDEYQDYFMPPPGTPDLYYKKPTGRYLVAPPSMKYCKDLDLFYHTDEVRIKKGRANKLHTVIGEIHSDGTEETWYRTTATV